MKHTNVVEEKTDNTVPLHQHAMDNISYIRDTMSRSSQFTGVPGWGMVTVGGLATLGSYVANLRLNPDWWVNTWIAIGIVSILIGILSLRLKAKKNETKVLTAPGKRFLMCFSPAMVVGIALTNIFYLQDLQHLLPCMWLFLYGVAVLNASAFSIPIVPLWGICVFVLGFVAMQLPYTTGTIILNYTPLDLCMLAGFGFTHIIFGLIIAVRYGG